jgi:hypothetical protein
VTGRRYSRARVAASDGCAAAGILLLIFAGLAPAEWYPAVALFLGVAFLAASHVLTPCVDRIAVWRASRSEKNV